MSKNQWLDSLDRKDVMLFRTRDILSPVCILAYKITAEILKVNGESRHTFAKELYEPMAFVQRCKDIDFTKLTRKTFFSIKFQIDNFKKENGEITQKMCRADSEFSWPMINGFFKAFKSTSWIIKINLRPSHSLLSFIARTARSINGLPDMLKANTFRKQKQWLKLFAMKWANDNFKLKQIISTQRLCCNRTCFELVKKR